MEQSSLTKMDEAAKLRGISNLENSHYSQEKKPYCPQYQRVFPPEKYKSPLKLAVVLVAAIFISGLALIAALTFLPLSGWAKVLLGATSLSILILPAVYFLSLRPQLSYVAKLKDADEELFRACNKLEVHIETRTEELKRVNEALRADVERRKGTEEELKKTHQDLKSTEDELVQTEKLAALGRFAAAITHEVKNPLGIILGGAEYLEQKVLTEDEEITTTIQMIKNSTLRANSILQNMLKFARPSELKIEKVDLGKLIEDAVSIIKYKAQTGKINIIAQLAEEKMEVEVDKNQIQQVLFNIFINAIESLSRGGEIKIKTYKTIIKDAHSYRSNCVMEIRDTGEGISPENLHRVFEPFFSTKKAIKGTGLGLPIAKTIIDNHRGKLLIDSEVGKGTEVRIILPLPGP